ncbi:MAG: DUF362 domain-containing protein [Deltaproteobacteria bacterium]|nr:DUF362 domain-containing protein [Deltaproteobacteria bacterium]
MSGRDQQASAPPRVYTRRQAIGRVAATSAAALAALGLGAGLLGRRDRSSGVERRVIRDHRVARSAGAVELAIARGPDAAANVRRAIAALGGIEAFVRRGESVAIKPNVGWNRLAEQAANTNPEVVAEVVRLCLGAGSGAVWVTDYSVNDPERCFVRSGIAAAASAAGARVVLPDKSGFREVAAGGEILQAVDVLWPLVDADRVINLPCVKQHGLSLATLSLKNWYGAIGGHRVRLHQDIHRSIVDLAALFKPTLTVLDATRVLTANGPSGGSLDDVERLDTVAAGVDEVALDAWGCTLLGLVPTDVGFVAEAQRRGLGRADFRSLRVEEIAG